MNYDKEIDEILTNLEQYNLGDDPTTDEPFTTEETYAIYRDLAKAKQALIELVAKAKLEELLFWTSKDIHGNVIIDMDALNKRKAELSSNKQGGK